MEGTAFNLAEYLSVHPLDILAAPEPKIANLWVPENFAKDGKVYFLSANHRGDMYHIRGAMALEAHPLVMFNCTEKTKDLTDYLEKTKEDVFSTTWDKGLLTGDNNPGGSDYCQRKFTLLNESLATTIISDCVKGNENLKDLAKGVASIDKDNKEKLRTELQDVCKKLFPYEPSGSRRTILIQYRDTGTKGLGIYPELDSGELSVEKIAKDIKAIPNMGTETLDVVLCGNAKPIGDLPSIGEYYSKIDSTNWPKETKRDIEAFFLKVAFDSGYFSMAVGFRSGALDVFTFLGIPSISISVRQMVGEDRHRKLAVNGAFKRWNIQYELPRHTSTRYFGKKRDLLGSPWWAFDKTTLPTPGDKDKQSDPPSDFHKYDSEIVRIGIYNAICLLLSWKVNPSIKPVAQNRQFCNNICRPCHCSDLDKNGVHDFFVKEKELEEQDFETRREQIGERKEPKEDYNKWENNMKKDWEKLLK
jgi:hypothetical protein